MDRFYITDSKGINGRIKVLYKDFIVEEENSEKNCKVEILLGEEIEKNWPEEENLEYFLFEMEKMNLSVQEAIREISRYLHTSQKRFSYAGLKDKRALTSQIISIWKPDYKRLKAFKHSLIKIKPIKWSDKRVEIGDLIANRFRITIRELELSPDKIREEIENCFDKIKNGVPNYFGVQRFGGVRQVSHLIGKEIINRNFKDAVMLFLTKQSELENELTKSARSAISDENDFSKALKLFPSSCKYEKSMLHHLNKNPKDFIGAIQVIPKLVRKIFTHAYQSFLFNEIINKRFEIGINIEKQKDDVLINDNPTAPLFGYETKFALGKIGEMEHKTLEKEGIWLNDFKLKEIPELSVSGARREIVIIPENLEINNINIDENNKTVAIISFKLRKGSYATTILEEIMKSNILQ